MKTGPKGKDLTKFVRFGNLDHNKKQDKTFRTSGTFHSAPTNKGFYAMPKIRQEFFLISCIANTQKNSQFSKDENLSDYKIYKNVRKEFKKIKGSVWHHLGDYCKVTEILERKGSWVKTEMEIWRKAFNKACLNDRYGPSGDKDWGVNSINKARGINGFYSGDHYEVFIDEKV